MSTRTIIEINHDVLHDIAQDPTRVVEFIRMLGLSLGTAERYAPNGIRILGQRHHSEKLEITVE